MGKSDRERRFRRLTPQTADLFEHFGVGAPPADPPADVQRIAVAACPRCGWWRATPLTEPCWMCAANGGTAP